MSDTIFVMTCPSCKKIHKVTESEGIVLCSCGMTLADEKYFKLVDGELIRR